MLVQKTKIKQLIRSENLRMSPDAFDGINRAVESVVKQMCQNVRDDGMKTLMIQHTKIAGRVSESQETNGKRCANYPECVNLKPIFLRWAKDTQRYCHDQAVILSRKV